MSCWGRQSRGLALPASAVRRPASFRSPALLRAVRRRVDDAGLGQNFIDCSREQGPLMPPDLREWLPEGHLAWFVIDAVAEMDLHHHKTALAVA